MNNAVEKLTSLVQLSRSAAQHSGGSPVLRSVTNPRARASPPSRSRSCGRPMRGRVARDEIGKPRNSAIHDRGAARRRGRRGRRRRRGVGHGRCAERSTTPGRWRACHWQTACRSVKCGSIRSCALSTTSGRREGRGQPAVARRPGSHTEAERERPACRSRAEPAPLPLPPDVAMASAAPPPVAPPAGSCHGGRAPRAAIRRSAVSRSRAGGVLGQERPGFCYHSLRFGWAARSELTSSTNRARGLGLQPRGDALQVKRVRTLLPTTGASSPGNFTEGGHLRTRSEGL